MPCKHSQKRLPTNGYPNLQRKKRHAKIYNHQNSLRMEERKIRHTREYGTHLAHDSKHPQPAGKPCGTPVPRMGLYDRRDRPAQLLVQHRRMPSRLVLHLVSHSHHRLSADAVVPGQEADGAPHGDRPHRRQGLVSILIIIDSDLPLFAISRTLLPTQSFRTHYTGDGYGNGNNRNDRSFENIHRRRTYLYGSFSPLPFIRLFPEKNRNF